MDIRIKYCNKDYPRLERIDEGTWVDLRVDSIVGYNGIDIDNTNELDIVNTELQTIHYKKGDVLFLSLGVAMELPEGYEAYVAPRSSTFKKTGLLLTNGIGM